VTPYGFVESGVAVRCPPSDRTTEDIFKGSAFASHTKGTAHNRNIGGRA
jgi:hypothetical protein